MVGYGREGVRLEYSTHPVAVMIWIFSNESETGIQDSWCPKHIQQDFFFSSVLLGLDREEHTIKGGHRAIQTTNMNVCLQEVEGEGNKGSFLPNSVWGDWRDDLADKSNCYSCREPLFRSQHTRGLSTISNWRSTESVVFLCLHRHIQLCRQDFKQIKCKTNTNCKISLWIQWCFCLKKPILVYAAVLSCLCRFLSVTHTESQWCET